MPTDDIADLKIDEDEKETDDEQAPSPPSSPTRQLPTGFWVLGGVAAVFVALSVVLLVLLVNERNDAGRRETEDTVRSTSAQLVEALVNFRPDGGDARREVVHKLGNGPILSQYDAAVTAFAQAASAVGIESVESNITETYVGQVEADEAQVVVVFDVNVQGSQPRTIPNQYMRVHLARIGSTWKVDNVQSVNLALAALAGAGTSDTTVPSTTAPPATSTGG